MSKKSAKQATLFQSWGSKKREPDESVVSNVCEASTTSGVTAFDNDPNSVIDLCDSFDDEDDQILCEAEESVSSSLNKSSDGSSPYRNGTANCSKNPTTYDGNISVGVDDGLSTQAHPTQITELPGFDSSTGKLWIYPTNYPVRDYQFNIVQQALFKNTMVTLPTGLGKTFIAAVVMYNFYRWYPQGKVIFMAPTKPLVAQQIEACYNIIGIPQDHTAEMTGSMGPSKREKAWREKRVFFLTPQVLTNDLSRGSCPAEMVKCLVIDEAHKALGNHAYCQVVRELVKYTQSFRILALSATPGSDIKAVQQVLTNLLISHIEIRTEESIDIKQYSHERKVDKVVVALGDELLKVKERYIHIMDVVVGRLKRQGVLYNRETTNFSKFLVLKAREAFRQNPPEKLPRNQYGVVEGDFALAMSLYHGYELLQLHGSRSLYNFLDGIISGEKSYGRTRTELLRNADFNQLMEMLAGKYKIPDGLTASQVDARPKVVGHPKMEKLQEIVLEHFSRHVDGPTRVMIFSQYRDSVQEITDMLHAHRPRVKVMSFIGQASAGKNTKGFTQKEQLKVMKQFREGGYNTLVSTCVGEEGLDIGDVDLIICFDAHKSPIRLVQRMGRTGRKREGRIVMLVTEGKEEQIYNQSQYSKRSIHKAILNGARSLHFYQHSPRMVPDGYHPACHKMHITVKQAFKPTKKLTTEKVVDQSRRISSSHTAGSLEPDEVLTLAEYLELVPWLVPEDQVPQLPATRIAVLDKGDDSAQEVEWNLLSLSEWALWQTTLQDTGRVGHGEPARHLVQIMEFVQLQQSLDPEDDPYGLEMAAYFNEEDVITERHTEQPGSIMKYCTNKQQNFQVKATAGRFKNRLSEALSKLQEAEGMDTDDELPEINIKTTKTLTTQNLNCNIEKGCSNNIYSPKSKTQYYATELKSECQATKRPNKQQNLEVEEEINEAMDILDENTVEEQTNLKVISKGKKVITSKAKSLEQKMNEVRIRKRKKSRNASGHTSVVQLITDIDSNDFDSTEIGGAVPDEGLFETNDKFKKCPLPVGKEDCVLNTTKSVEDITSDYIRIRTPPPAEEAIRLCEELDKNSEKFEVDLVALVDEWHQENKQGKYIIFPERYKSRMAYSPCDHPQSCGATDKPVKMYVPNKDIIVSTSISADRVNDKQCLPLQTLDLESDTLTEKDCDIQNGKHSKTATESEKHILKSSKTPNTFMARSHDDASTDNGTVMESDNFIVNYKSCGKTASSTDSAHSVKHSTETATAVEDDNDDEWMNTGSFTIDLDIKGFVEKSKEMTMNADSTKLASQSIKTSTDNCIFSCSKIKDKNIEVIVDKHCKSLFDECEDAIKLSDDEFKEQINECPQQIPLLKPNPTSTKLSSWPFEDEMADDVLLEENKIAFAKKTVESGSQITFTQALSFVGEHTPNTESLRAKSVSGKEDETSEVSKILFSSEESVDLFPDDSVNFDDPSNKEVLMTSERFDLNATDDHDIDCLNTGNVDPKCVFPLITDICKTDEYPKNVSEGHKNNVADGKKTHSPSYEIDNQLTTLSKNSNNNSTNGKSSTSSEEEMDLPVFDLGFDVDDDIIPPSPDVKPSQSQKSARLSQAFNMTGKFNSKNRASLCATKEDVEDDLFAVSNQPRSKKCLQMNSVDDIQCGDLVNEEEELQSVLDFGRRHSVTKLSKKLSFIPSKSKLNSVSEIEEQGFGMLKGSGMDSPSREKRLRQTERNSILNDNDACKDKSKEMVEANAVGGKNAVAEKIEMSFSLLDTDLDEWIDSGSDVMLVNIKNMNNKYINTAVVLNSKDNSPGNKKYIKTPVATVTPFNVSKESHSRPPPSKRGIASSRKSNARMSVFKIDDLSPDFFDDESFTYDESELQKQTTNALSLPSRIQCNTSTPLGPHGHQVQNVTPFRLHSSTPVSKNKAGSSAIGVANETEIQAKLSIQMLSPGLNRDGYENQEATFDPRSIGSASFEKTKHIADNSASVNKSSSVLDKSVNDDSFIVVRKNKKITVLDSPSSQHCETPKGASNISAHSSSTDNNDDDFDDCFMMTQNNYISAKKSQPLSVNGVFDISDDDFEENFVKHHVSDDDFEESFAKPKLSDNRNNGKGKSFVKKPKPAKVAAKSKRSKNPFVEEEAELSEEDADGASSDEDEGSDMDQYENSFIHDSQFTALQAANQTDIHAIYLKSVRSPVGGSGKFKLQYEYNDIDVFSQAPGPEESHYVEDSFCVGSEAEDEWMLREEEEEDSDDEPRDITLMKGENSLMQSVRKTRRRKGGVTSFLTSRQREIQMGRMKALDKIRSRLNNKKTCSENVGTTVDKTKGKKRIQVLNEYSSDEENIHPFSQANKSRNHSHISTDSRHSFLKGKKRARFLMSSDDSDNEDFTDLKTARKSTRLDDSDEVRPDQTLNNVRTANCDETNRTVSAKEKNAHNKMPIYNPYQAASVSEALLNDSSKDKPAVKPVILVDSKEISGSQDIISDLRFKHDIQVHAAQLHGCDYVISNRMAVERKQWSEFSNGANRAKLVERLLELGELYDRPCLIVEKDRLKPREEKSARPVHWTKYVDRTVAMLMKSDVKVLFTEDCFETGALLAELCRLEVRKNMNITASVNLNEEQLSRVKFLVSFPKLSYVNALNICQGFRSMKEFLQSPATLIERRGKISAARAAEVYNYIQRSFDSNGLPSSYK